MVVHYIGDARREAGWREAGHHQRGFTADDDETPANPALPKENL